MEKATYKTPIDGRVHRVLLIEDDEMCQTLYSRALQKKTHSVATASSLSEGIERLKKGPGYDLVLLDIHLPDNNDVEGLKAVKQAAPLCPVVILTGDETVDQAMRFMSSGADEFLVKSWPIKDIVNRVDDFLSSDYVTKEFRDYSHVTGIINESPQLRQILGKLERLRDVSSPILISGESGTGKEKIAQFIHKSSTRSDGPFIALNCAAIAPTLFEAELFGYKKGAFTDAKKDKKGFFELCNHGTLFLDEIGELPLELQSKLLRVLQENEITPVGGVETIKINTRVISATNKELNPESPNSLFRKDLFYRLSVFQFTIPPLRERREDIMGLARNFASEYASAYKKDIKVFSKELNDVILDYSWPGNVRELRNSIERGVALSEDGNIKVSDLFHRKSSIPELQKQNVPVTLLERPFDEAELEFQKEYLAYHLDRCGQNISEVARVTKKNRMWVYRLSEKLKNYEKDKQGPVNTTS